MSYFLNVFNTKTRLSQGLLPDTELLKKVSPTKLDIKTPWHASEILKSVLSILKLLIARIILLETNKVLVGLLSSLDV